MMHGTEAVLECNESKTAALKMEPKIEQVEPLEVIQTASTDRVTNGSENTSVERTTRTEGYDGAMRFCHFMHDFFTN